MIKKILCLLPVAAFLLTGCMNEGFTYCPGNVNLNFTYTGDTGDHSMFGKMIDQVEVLVFDGNGDRVLSSTMDKSSLSAAQMANFKLMPGDYRIVCWANAFEHTQLLSCEQHSDGRVHHPNLTGSASVPTNDHLYYGTCNVTVAPSGTVSADLVFRGAHVDLRVYVKSNFSAGSGSDTDCVVELHNLMPQYDLDMRECLSFGTTYCPEVSYNADQRVHESLFQTLRFGDDNPLVLEAKIPSTGSSYSFSLKDYMAENGISIDGKNEAVVSVMVEFSDVGVTITVPEWATNPVTPES